jgi:hypothetical protein
MRLLETVTASSGSNLSFEVKLTFDSTTHHQVFTSPDKAEAFAVKDPYVQNDLVVGFSVRGWSVVAGSLYGNIDK